MIQDGVRDIAVADHAEVNRLRDCCDAFARADFLVHTATVPALFVHCHCDTIEVAKGFGRVNLTERNAAAQARLKIATISKISWRVHNVRVMALAPIPVRGS
jgi:hypothetical protein